MLNAKQLAQLIIDIVEKHLYILKILLIHYFQLTPLGGKLKVMLCSYIHRYVLIQLVNIFGSGRVIFLKSFGDIPLMFVH